VEPRVDLARLLAPAQRLALVAQPGVALLRLLAVVVAGVGEAVPGQQPPTEVVDALADVTLDQLREGQLVGHGLRLVGAPPPAHLAVQAFLSVEVVRDELLVHPGAGGDLGHPGAGEPLGREDGGGRLDDPRLRPLGVALPLVRGRRPSPLARGHPRHSAEAAARASGSPRQSHTTICRRTTAAKKTTMNARSMPTDPNRTGGRTLRTGASTGSVRECVTRCALRRHSGSGPDDRAAIQSTTARATSTIWKSNSSVPSSAPIADIPSPPDSLTVQRREGWQSVRIPRIATCGPGLTRPTPRLGRTHTATRVHSQRDSPNGGASPLGETRTRSRRVRGPARPSRGPVRASRDLGARQAGPRRRRAGVPVRASRDLRAPLSATAHSARDSAAPTPRLAGTHSATRGHRERDSRGLRARLAGGRGSGSGACRSPPRRTAAPAGPARCGGPPRCARRRRPRAGARR